MVVGGVVSPFNAQPRKTKKWEKMKNKNKKRGEKDEKEKKEEKRQNNIEITDYPLHLHPPIEYTCFAVPFLLVRAFMEGWCLAC